MQSLAEALAKRSHPENQTLVVLVRNYLQPQFDTLICFIYLC